MRAQRANILLPLGLALGVVALVLSRRRPAVAPPVTPEQTTPIGTGPGGAPPPAAPRPSRLRVKREAGTEMFSAPPTSGVNVQRVTTVPRGGYVALLGQEGAWMYVRYPYTSLRGGQVYRGYISANDVEATAPAPDAESTIDFGSVAPQATPPTAAVDTTIYYGGYDVLEAGGRPTAYALLPRGTTVTVLDTRSGALTNRYGQSESGRWMRVRGVSGDGWVRGDHLTLGSTVATGASAGATSPGYPGRAVVRPRYGVREIPMFGTLNERDRRAISFIPAGVELETYEQRQGTGWVPRDAAICEAVRQSTQAFKGCPSAFGSGVRAFVNSLFRRARYRAPDGTDHVGYVEEADLAAPSPPPAPPAPAPPPPRRPIGIAHLGKAPRPIGIAHLGKATPLPVLVALVDTVVYLGDYVVGSGQQPPSEVLARGGRVTSTSAEPNTDRLGAIVNRQGQPETALWKSVRLSDGRTGWARLDALAPADAGV